MGMGDSLSAEDARSALAAVDLGRRRVIEQVDLPQWYWGGLAIGWVVLGVLADSGHPILSTVATFVFGAAHATIAPRILDGRHRSQRLSVRTGLVTRRLPALVIGCLVVLGALTVAGALAVSADGAHHPVTTTSVGAAVTTLLGGPQLLAAVRRRALRGLSPA
jgi:hypothetical protein